MTTTMQPPTRVEQREVDQALRVGGPDSTAYQHLREMREAWVAHLAENKRENDRVAAEREKREAAAEQARVAEREAERQRDMEALKSALRDRYFRANPQAGPDDYARVAQRMLDDEMVRRATDSRDADVEALRARSPLL